LGCEIRQELRGLDLKTAASEVAFSPDGRMIGTLGSMGDTSLWDTASGSKVRDFSSSPMSNLSQIMSGQGGFTPGQLKTMRSGKPGSMPQMPDLSAITG
jgi:WD40 repeat protein